MNGPVLVAYATKYGSTREVAERVAAGLQAKGLTAEVKAASEVTSLGSYGAVVLGAPLYIGSLLKDATAFLDRNHAALADMPVALFVLGPMRASDDMSGPREQVDAALAKVPWLSPVSSVVFVGAYDPAKLKMADKLIAVLPASPLHGVEATDERDWPAIDAWIGSLPDAFAAAGR
jgi:menaquinone-dependent protoporphyrinogen oxidase